MEIFTTEIDNSINHLYDYATHRIKYNIFFGIIFRFEIKLILLHCKYLQPLHTEYIKLSLKYC